MTPRASPSVDPSDLRPSKRSRLSRSTLRVLSVWDQLAERYNRRLDEDDIVDLYSGAIISDRGVLKNAEKDYDIGHFAHDDNPDDQAQEQADADELDTLPASETMASTSELLRAIPPLSATTDSDDLNEFLQAERKRREVLGDQGGEGEMSMEELDAVREALRRQEDEEQQGDEEQSEIVAEDESEDELSLWQHEASAVYHIARKESEQDAAEGEQTIIELTDSDEEFATLLERPPRTLKRKRVSSSSSHRRTSSGHTPVPDTSPTASSARFSSRISYPDTPALDTPTQSSTRFARRTSCQATPVPDIAPAPTSTRFAPRISSKYTQEPDIPRAESSTRLASRISSQYVPVPDTPVVSSTHSVSRKSSKATSVLGTPLAAPNTRFASYAPRTPVPTFPSHPVDIDPTQSPQHLLYQAMQHLSYALSALSYSSPPVPPPPLAPWGDASFAHPSGPRTTLDDDTTLVDDDSTPEVENDGSVAEDDRRRMGFRSTIGPKSKIEYRKGIQSDRSYPVQDDRQDKRSVPMRRGHESPLDARNPVARVQSGRSRPVQEGKQGKRTVMMRQSHEFPLDARNPIARAKKKGNVKSK